MNKLSRLGRVRLDNGAGWPSSGGQSVGPDRHQIDLDGRQLWTWCDYDVAGIFGALRASGKWLI